MKTAHPAIRKSLFTTAVVMVMLTLTTHAQTQLEGWGNISGYRIDGQLMEFETSLVIVGKGWTTLKATAKEAQRPKYERQGTAQVVTTTVNPVSFTEQVSELPGNSAKIRVTLTANQAVEGEGIYLALWLPAKYYSSGSVTAGPGSTVSLSASPSQIGATLAGPVSQLNFSSKERQLQVNLPVASAITVRNEQVNGAGQLKFYLPIVLGDLEKGGQATAELIIHASGTVDRSPVALTINPAITGRVFEGFGGNFRLQNPRTDPEVIDYCLDNMRLVRGRVEMPWRAWQPVKNSSPIDSAKAGKLNPAVQKAMEMAKRLHDKGIEVILSAWAPPAWAVEGPLRNGLGADGIWGNPLDPAAIQESYKSIADYIVYLRDQYGAEPALFSFNESDLGINVRLTGRQHAELIKGLGAYFAQRGVKTKLLLGDNSDATTYEFIYPAMNDPETWPYIGAISFHSWRGWGTLTLQKWADAAAKLNKPLIVAEGSIDAQAYGYPMMFLEPLYAIEEINLYVRLLNICQPAAILQWQLTADYSPLAGGGIFGDNGPLRPTQRFWNLKQLAATPANLKAMPAASDKESITVAALGDAARGIYAIHAVNNGAARQATLSGIPPKIKWLKIWQTNSRQSFEAGKPVPVKNGKASFELPAGTYVTLLGGA